MLYIFSLIVFILANYFLGKAPENAQNLLQAWMLTFGLVALDTSIRLRQSAFLFFPLGYLIIIGYQYVQMLQGQVSGAWGSAMQIMGAVLHLVLGIWFLIQFFRTEKQDKELRAFYIAAGVAAVFFGTHIVSFLANVPTLEKLHALRLSSYLMIATSGRFLLLDQVGSRQPINATLMPMVLLIHTFIIAAKVVQNFFS